MKYLLKFFLLFGLFFSRKNLFNRILLRFFFQVTWAVCQPSLAAWKQVGTFVAAHGNKERNEEATNNPNLHKIKIEKATLLRVNIWILMTFSSHLIQSIQ